MAASIRTKRNFSGNSARAFSRCAWNSLEAARSSAVAAGGWRSGCDQSVSRSSRRFPERKRSSARRNAIRTSHAKGKRAALGKALLELAPRVSLGCLARQLILLLMPDRKAVVVLCDRKAIDRATWLDQNQLLHLSSCARFECPSSPRLTRRRGRRIGSVRSGRSRCFRSSRLDAQPSDQFFKVGFVDDHFSGWLARRSGLDGAFVESLKEAHLGDGI